MDFLKYFIPFSLVLVLVFGAFFVHGTVTGRACIFCQPGTSAKVNYANPTEQDIDMLVFMGGMLCFMPVGALIIFGLVITLLRVTATPKQREDAKTAKEMGEDGIGPLLFGG